MENITIKKATPAELPTLQHLGRATFQETFAASNTKEDMERYLKESFSEDKLSAELANPDSQFFIAWEGDVPVGYLKLNTAGAQTEQQDKNALEIERIYVMASHHGKKVGQLLYEKALEVATQKQSSYLWLGVWEENPRAIRFYEKNGFVPFGQHVFKMGSDEQTDIMMKKELRDLT